mmetsp:Transcript_33942/g.95515  ORF Transcript_33942/g.95515 Transcript_33942/m.95515 type:complete len:233 (+) Transcript_33942:2722-3420(+)
MRTAVHLRASTARRIAPLMSSTVTSPSVSMYFSPNSSSRSTRLSRSSCRFSATSSICKGGISVVRVGCSPRSPSKYTASCVTRSTRPYSVASSPMGTCNNNAVTPSLFLRLSTARNGSAPERSSLLMKVRCGTLYRFICRCTVKVWLCTPATPHSTSTAPSSTRSARSTSMVKSTCPGVSMMLIWWTGSPHTQCVAADLIVIPFSRSRSMLSIVAPTPSLPRTSWILPIRPV